MPQFKEVTIPAGTSLSVKLLSAVASNTSHVEDAVKGSISRAVIIDGLTAVPEGTPISGTVVEANESGRVKGRASVGIKFDRLSIRNESQKVQTAAVRREAEADKKSDVKKGGIGAGLGAVVGGVIGGGKGAAIGAVAGGTGTVLATKGGEVEVPAGTVVSVLLQEPLTVTVPLK
ncbi:MAG TPA: YMGG-like glycine zipper-containing protein [Vicinamibacterales bacterium]